MKIKIFVEDTDLGGIVYHTNYLKYCERARSEVFFSKNIPLVTEEGHFVVKDIVCSFLSPATLGDELEVRSKLLELKGASFLLEQKIYKEEKEIFFAKITIVFISNNRAKKIPTKLREVIKTHF